MKNDKVRNEQTINISEVLKCQCEVCLVVRRTAEGKLDFKMRVANIFYSITSMETSF